MGETTMNTENCFMYDNEKRMNDNLRSALEQVEETKVKFEKLKQEKENLEKRVANLDTENMKLICRNNSLEEEINDLKKYIRSLEFFEADGTTRSPLTREEYDILVDDLKAEVYKHKQTIASCQKALHDRNQKISELKNENERLQHDLLQAQSKVMNELQNKDQPIKELQNKLGNAEEEIRAYRKSNYSLRKQLLMYRDAYDELLVDYSDLRVMYEDFLEYHPDVLLCDLADMEALKTNGDLCKEPNDRT